MKTSEYAAVAAAHSVDPDRWQSEFSAVLDRIESRFARYEPLRHAGELMDSESSWLPQVLGYLRALQREYASNYLRVTECQRYDDDITRRHLTNLVAEDARLDTVPSFASHRTWKLLQDGQHCPVLHDMIGCGVQYTEKFLRPLNTLAAQVARTTGSCRPFVADFDRQIDKIADDIRDAAEQQQEQLRSEEEPAGAACSLSAKPSVISLSPSGTVS